MTSGNLEVRLIVTENHPDDPENYKLFMGYRNRNAIKIAHVLPRWLTPL